MSFIRKLLNSYTARRARQANGPVGTVFLGGHYHSLDAAAQKDWAFLPEYIAELFRTRGAHAQFSHACKVFRNISEDQRQQAYRMFCDGRIYTGTRGYYVAGDAKSGDLSFVSSVPREIGVMLITASCGYVRQEALEVWGPTLDEAEVLFAISRLNDWVPAVRATALAIVEPIFAAMTSKEIAVYLPDLVQLERASRHDCPQFIRDTMRRMAQDTEQSLAILLNGDRKAARVFFKQIWGDETLDRPRILQAVAHARDPVLRRLVFKAALALPQDVARKAFDLFENDQDPSVRRERVRFSMKLGDDVFEKTLKLALMDSHGGVRYLAQYWTRQRRGEGAGARYYREMLAQHDDSPKEKAVAVQGCAETGEKLELATLRACFDGESNMLKKAVFSHSNVPSDWAWECFKKGNASSLKVCREAVAFLQRYGKTFTADELMEAFNGEPGSRKREALLSLVATRPYWERLYTCLVVWGQLPNHRKHQVQSILNGWRARTDIGARPGPELFARIKKEIERLERLDDPDLKLKEIKWAIKGWRLD